MPAPTVHIDRLDLDLRGIPAATAQSALSALGPALAQALTARPVRSAAPASTRIDRVDAGRIPLGARAGAEGLRDSLAQRLATTVAGQFGPPPTP